MNGPEEYISRFEEICRSNGLKLTHQRLELYQALLESRDHPSAESLHKQLLHRMPTISLDTVYRTLATFEELGLVRRVETVGSQSRFEVRTVAHHHFFCDQCGRLTDFSWNSFDALGLPRELQKMGRIRERNVVLHGVCNHCLDPP